MAALNAANYSADYNIPVGSLTKGSMVLRQAVIAIPATGAGTALNDTLGAFTVPKGAILRSLILRADRLDTNGSPLLTIDLGDASDAQKYVAAWAGASGVVTAVSPNTVSMKIANYGAQFLADTPIFATIHAAAATKAAGTLVITVEYEMGGLAS